MNPKFTKILFAAGVNFILFLSVTY